MFKSNTKIKTQMTGMYPMMLYDQIIFVISFLVLSFSRDFRIKWYPEFCDVKISMVKVNIIYLEYIIAQPSLWRNRLARSAVNRKVGGSSPPRDDIFFAQNCSYFIKKNNNKKKKKKKNTKKTQKTTKHKICSHIDFRRY